MKYYMTKKREYIWYQRIARLLIFIIILPVILGWLHKVLPSRDVLLNPYVSAQEVKKVAVQVDDQEMISYIKTIFGKNWRVAVAVAKAECWGLHQECRLVTEREHSVSIWQINIKAHAAKIPGKTLEEKELWLVSDHRHATLIAKLIFDESGFWPWTAYKTGAYKKYL